MARYVYQSIPMIKFSFGTYRAYFAATVIIAMMHLARSHLHVDGTPGEAWIAGISDFLVLGFLVLLYRGVMHFTPAGSPIEKLNNRMHLFAVFLIVVFAATAQALFVKTGESLNLDMMFFFLGRAADLNDVAKGAIDKELLLIPLVILAIVMLTSLHIANRVLAWGQYLVLLLPIGIVLAGPLIQPERVGDDTEVVLRGDKTAAQLYQGKYQNMFKEQLDWNMSETAKWRRGILTGLSVSEIGTTAIQLLAKDGSVEAIYEPPHAAHASPSRPNILFVVLESFRYDVVGAYSAMGTGQESKTPFLDEIARKGWQVERAYTTIPHTTKALVGIYCGTFARMETNVSEAIPGNLPLTCLPRLLGEVGYRSAHFQTAIGTFEDRLPFLANVGFDERFTMESYSGGQGTWTKLGYLGIDDHAMIEPAINWMQRQKNNGVPFFASMLTLTTHHPYVTPVRIEAVSEPEQAKKAYEDGVRYTDGWLRNFFGKMQKLGLLDNTLVVITGDHGEAFFEHGTLSHNATAYEEGIRVPLILSGPMLGDHKVVHGLRQHIDIMPTVLDIAGVEYAGRLPGTALRGNSQGHADLITSCFYHDYCLTHLSSDGGKEIFFYGKRDVEIYDLDSDPQEAHNLYAKSTRDNALQRLSFAYKMKTSFEAVYRSQDSRAVATLSQ